MFIREFAKDTESIGSERVSAVNEIADSLISVGHTDAATIAQWKDSLNDAWADLLELIDTRNQMLEASRELHAQKTELSKASQGIKVFA